MGFEKKSRVIATYSRRKQFVRVVRDTWKDDVINDVRSEPTKKQLTSTPLRETQSRFAPGLSTVCLDLVKSGSLREDLHQSEPRQSFHPRQITGKRAMRREPAPQAPTPVHHLLKDSDLFKSPSLFRFNFSSQLNPSSQRAEEEKENVLKERCLAPTDFITPGPNYNRRENVAVKRPSCSQKSISPPARPLLQQRPNVPAAEPILPELTRPLDIVPAPESISPQLPPVSSPESCLEASTESSLEASKKSSLEPSTHSLPNSTADHSPIKPPPARSSPAIKAVSLVENLSKPVWEDSSMAELSVRSPKVENPSKSVWEDSSMAELSADLSAMSVTESSSVTERKFGFDRDLMLSQTVPSFNKLLSQCSKVESLLKLVEHEPSLRKIGEGTFGEVFMGKTVVYKIIPVGGSTIINEVDQTTYENAFQEIVVSRQLSDLASDSVENGKAFCQLIDVVYCRGAYPTCLLEAWDKFSNPDNERPDTLPEEQQYVVLLSKYGGIQLEEFCTNHQLTPDETHSILRQVCCSLAAAEQKYDFEHRDLHWGNVLIMPTDIEIVEFAQAGEQYIFKSHGILATIIDFTFSRIESDGCLNFVDLEQEEWLFQGNVKGDIQARVYRDMRSACRKNWEKFTPKTNVLWILYLLDKMLEGRRSLKLRKLRTGLQTARSATEALAIAFRSL